MPCYIAGNQAVVHTFAQFATKCDCGETMTPAPGEPRTEKGRAAFGKAYPDTKPPKVNPMPGAPYCEHCPLSRFIHFLWGCAGGR